MPDDLSEAIEENAKSPKKATGDSGSFEQHSLPDQIAADKHLASKAATKKKTRGVRFSKFTPPGAA